MRTTSTGTHYERTQRISRVDEAFRTLLILGPIFLTLVWNFPGISEDRYQALVAALVIAIVGWSVGYIWADHPYAVQLRLAAWLIWVVDITILAVFSIWRIFVGIVGGNVWILRFVTTIIAFGAATVIWTAVGRIYLTQARKASWVLVVAGLLSSVLIPLITIR